jgi:hypothetical protein
MRELIIEETTMVSGGLFPGPGSCSFRAMATSFGFGALGGIPGFAGGPIAGFSGMLFTGSVGAIYQLNTCAQDLRK